LANDNVSTKDTIAMLIESSINLGISDKLGTPGAVLDIYKDATLIT
jgi:hypothetical protein